MRVFEYEEGEGCVADEAHGFCKKSSRKLDGLCRDFVREQLTDFDSGEGVAGLG